MPGATVASSLLEGFGRSSDNFQAHGKASQGCPRSHGATALGSDHQVGAEQMQQVKTTVTQTQAAGFGSADCVQKILFALRARVEVIHQSIPKTMCIVAYRVPTRRSSPVTSNSSGKRPRQHNCKGQTLRESRTCHGISGSKGNL